jgi:uncharacterized protein (DUF952 family)
MMDPGPPLEAPPGSVLFHVAEPDEWDTRAATYAPRSLGREGFVHLSAGHQVLATTGRHYEGRVGLVLLEVDAAALDADKLRWETAPHGEDYPHFYGPLPVAAVTAVHPWPS